MFYALRRGSLLGFLAVRAILPSIEIKVSKQSNMAIRYPDNRAIVNTSYSLSDIAINFSSFQRIFGRVGLILKTNPCPVGTLVLLATGG
jgi:hypothetical protein